MKSFGLRAWCREEQLSQGVRSLSPLHSSRYRGLACFNLDFLRPSSASQSLRFIKSFQAPTNLFWESFQAQASRYGFYSASCQGCCLKRNYCYRILIAFTIRTKKPLLAQGSYTKPSPTFLIGSLHGASRKQTFTFYTPSLPSQSQCPACAKPMRSVLGPGPGLRSSLASDH